MVVFHIEANGGWVCKKPDMIHNHELLLEDKVYKLRPHKKVQKIHVEFFQKMRRNGMKVFYAYRLLRNEVGGSPSLGFSERDAYNSVANEVKMNLDGSDANHLMCALEVRRGNEQDFFISLNSTRTMV